MIPGIFGLSGTSLRESERAFLRFYDPVGVILFARNVETPDQVRALTADIRDTLDRNDAPVLIDQEGGRVQRLGWHRWPAARDQSIEDAKQIGQALLENCVYDENGQLLSASYMDYAMPRAGDVPSFEIDHSACTPCTHNPLGVKGCGEAGAIGSPPAVVNAVIDALNSGGKKVAHIDMPMSPARVWAAMQG